MRQTIRDKYYQIKELAINLERVKYVISFLEQENNQLKTKDLILEKEKSKLLQKVGKGKEIMESSDPGASKGRGKRKRPRTRGLKKALQEEQEQILLNEDLDLEDWIALEVNQDKEYWLNRVNEHLEKLLEKENMDNQLLRHMDHHYQAQNMIANVKLKQLENKLKEAKKDPKDEGNLEMLAKASMKL